MVEWFDRANKCIAQGGLTNSKWPESYIRGVYPTHIKGANGCHLYDTNDIKYVDFICGLGSNLFGYGNEKITQAVMRHLYNGANHSLPTIHEVRAAEKLKEIFPYIERVKWLKTGSDACTSAIRFARAYQGVENGNTDLFEMWRDEIIDRISLEKEGCEAQRKMQGLCEGTSQSTTCQRNKETSTTEICSFSQGKRNGKKIFSNKKGESKGNGAVPSSSYNEMGYKAWSFEKEALPSMWRRKLSGTSSRLPKTSSNSMAVSNSSRRSTPKWLILSDAYHGYHDQFVSLTNPAKGVPFDAGILPLTGNEDLIEIAAAVIVEPVIIDDSRDRIDWLRELRKECDESGALLIFDEVITGLRYENYGVSTCYGIKPDLVCLGKAIGGGYSLACVAGRADILDDKEVFVSSTYAGETFPLIAGREAMELMQKNSDYNLNYLIEKGKEFIAEFNNLGGVQIEGYGTRGTLKGDINERALFCQEMAKARVLFHPATWFFNFPLIDVMDDVLNLVKAVKDKIATGSVKLEYPLPESPFSAKVRKQ